MAHSASKGGNYIHVLKEVVALNTLRDSHKMQAGVPNGSRLIHAVK